MNYDRIEPKMQSYTESRLRSAGVTIVNTPGFYPSLVIRVARLADDATAIGIDRAFSWIIELDFNKSFLVGDQIIAASSYSDLAFGHAGILGLDLNSQLAKTMNDFIESWRTVN